MRTPRERGVAAVEFALVVPLLVTFLFGIVEGGTRYAQQNQINHAAFLAARDLSINPATSAADAVSAVYDHAFAIVSPTTSCPNNGTTPPVTVTIEAEYDSLSGLFGSYTLRGEGVARCE